MNNARIMDARFDVKHGKDLPQTKMDESDVKLIRALREDGMKYRDIGEKFDIHHTTAWRICNYLDHYRIR